MLCLLDNWPLCEIQGATQAMLYMSAMAMELQVYDVCHGYGRCA